MTACVLFPKDDGSITNSRWRWRNVLLCFSQWITMSNHAGWRMVEMGRNSGKMWTHPPQRLDVYHLYMSYIERQLIKIDRATRPCDDELMNLGFYFISRENSIINTIKFNPPSSSALHVLSLQHNFPRDFQRKTKTRTQTRKSCFSRWIIKSWSSSPGFLTRCKSLHPTPPRNEIPPPTYPRHRALPIKALRLLLDIKYTCTYPLSI